MNEIIIQGNSRIDYTAIQPEHMGMAAVKSSIVDSTGGLAETDLVAWVQERANNAAGGGNAQQQVTGQ